MMNKGLEVIEAHFLFDVDYSRIDVLVHPSSVVHSMVEFRDGATKAQLGVPDMRIPIALALADGERLPGVAPAADLPALVAAAVPAPRPPPVPGAGSGPPGRRAGRGGAGGPQRRQRGAASTPSCAGPAVSTRSPPWWVRRWRPPRTWSRPSLDDVLDADCWARERVADGARPAGAGARGRRADVRVPDLARRLPGPHHRRGGGPRGRPLRGRQALGDPGRRSSRSASGPGWQASSAGTPCTRSGPCRSGGFVKMPGMLGLEGEADVGERNFYRATSRGGQRPSSPGSASTSSSEPSAWRWSPPSRSPPRSPAGEPTAPTPGWSAAT